MAILSSYVRSMLGGRDTEDLGGLVDIGYKDFKIIRVYRIMDT